MEAYFPAWNNFEQVMRNVLPNFPQSIQFSRDMLTGERQNKIERFRYSAADCAEKYMIARSAAIDLAETVRTIVPEDHEAAQLAHDFLNLTEEAPAPRRGPPSAPDRSPDPA